MTVSASTTVWIAARTLLAHHVEKFFSEWEKTAATFQEDDVHDFRVASRRLREALALFAPCLSPKKRKRAAKLVKNVTRMLGDLRNTDEAFRFFSDLGAEGPSEAGDETETLLAGLRREREEAHARLRGELGALDPAPLRQDLQDLQDRPELFGKSADDPFAAFSFFAGGAIMDRAGPVAELLQQAVNEDDGAAQHRLRIAIKKLRYRIEIMEPIIRSGYEELRGALKEYQDMLGKLHDLDVFQEMVQERVREGPGKRSLLAAIAQKRHDQYDEFMAFLKKEPVDAIGGRAKEAL